MRDSPLKYLCLCVVRNDSHTALISKFRFEYVYEAILNHLTGKYFFFNLAVVRCSQQKTVFVSLPTAVVVKNMTVI